MATLKPPVSEIGTSNMMGATLASLPWAAWVDQTEYVPELLWPASVAVFDRMRNDAQLAGLTDGVTLPIRKYTWLLDPNGADPRIVEGLSADLGLDIRGQEPAPRRRRKRRFSFDDHLRQALEALVFGHEFFEQVGEIGEDGLWHLRKLAPRLPETILDIQVDADGGLRSIRQNVAIMGTQAPLIGIDRLVAYVWDQRPGSWVGRSMFRACYREWLIKDRLIRVDAVKHERNGMGIPFGVPAPGADKAQVEDLDAMAQRVRAGDSSGGSLPPGADIKLKGVEGSLPDTLASIRYLDQMMARRFLQMFGELGQTPNGSRALGEVQLDFFTLAQRQIADWFAGVFGEHVIEDWVDWNYGETTDTVPLLVYETNDDERLSVEGLVALIDSGAIVVDPDLEEAIRHQYGLPTPPVTAPAPLRAVARRRKRPGTAASGEPSPAERSQTDFADLQARFEEALTACLAGWETQRKALIDDLVNQAEAATTPAELASIAAEAPDVEWLTGTLNQVLAHGAETVRSEASAQGHTLTETDLTAAQAELAAAAEGKATLLARSLSQSAASRAFAVGTGVLTPGEVAAQVRDHLEGLTGADAEYELKGLTTKAQNTGRFTQMAATPDGTRFYASELNDSNVCEPCAEEDETEFASLDEAMSDYPGGGFLGCAGGGACRGTVVMVLPEAQPST